MVSSWSSAELVPGELVAIKCRRGQGRPTAGDRNSLLLEACAMLDLFDVPLIVSEHNVFKFSSSELLHPPPTYVFPPWRGDPAI